MTQLNGGGTYVRWGRTSCPGNGTETVYRGRPKISLNGFLSILSIVLLHSSGYVAGSFYTHKGAAANFLCLPETPEWGYYNDNAINDTAYVYGAEYQLDGRESDNGFIGNVYQQDAPCAVCRTSRKSVLMVPAKLTCFSGWTMEYSGYLVAGSALHEAATEYICLDGKPEMVPGKGENHNGKLMYLTEARCGSLPCPPYVNGRELTCVVCSR
ncbi:short-chain collagen C4-like [Dreissena polymorpha]|nr:short-chain collagen C4-like [Dreissena polymorpha]